MKQLLLFVGGFISGIIATLFFLFILSAGMRTGASKKDVQVQYVEVKGKHGRVNLHIGMPKDSVRILVGKPDEVNMRSIGNHVYEDWGYKIKKDYATDLDLDFEDGKLKTVRQD